MAFLFDLCLNELVAVGLGLFTAVYVWFKIRYTYWTRKGLLQADPVIPVGNVKRSFLGRNRLEFVLQDIYNQFKDENCVGVYEFHRPSLLCINPELIRLIMIMDFESFSDRDSPVNKDEPLTNHLFNLNGARWKRLRQKLSPVFTTGKLKMMCQRMEDCGRQMVQVLEEAAERREVLEMREISARYSTDIIASVVFGIESDCQRNPQSVFRQMGHEMFKPTLMMTLHHIIYKLLPAVASTFRLCAGKRHILNYFRKLVEETMEYREANKIFRNDFLQLMIEMKNKGVIDDKKTGIAEVDNWNFTVDDVAAQCLLYYAAGFETSSTTLSFALHELAVNPDIQRRLQQEVEEATKKVNGHLSYEVISEMEYMDKVVYETLRKYPPVALVTRRCTHDYQLPNNGPVIEKGTDVLIPTYALQHDPQYFPDPTRFDPERFSREEKSKRSPYVYLPFGLGPRDCLGMRLGLLQVKIGLAYLMSHYEVERCEQTKDPLEYDVRSILLSSNTGIQLRLVKKA